MEYATIESEVVFLFYELEVGATLLLLVFVVEILDLGEIGLLPVSFEEISKVFLFVELLVLGIHLVRNRFSVMLVKNTRYFGFLVYSRVCLNILHLNLNLLFNGQLSLLILPHYLILGYAPQLMSQRHAHAQQLDYQQLGSPVLGDHQIL